jgi:hypothetical protein
MPAPVKNTDPSPRSTDTSEPPLYDPEKEFVPHPRDANREKNTEPWVRPETQYAIALWPNGVLAGCTVDRGIPVSDGSGVEGPMLDGFRFGAPPSIPDDSDPRQGMNDEAHTRQVGTPAELRTALETSRKAFDKGLAANAGRYTFLKIDPRRFNNATAYSHRVDVKKGEVTRVRTLAQTFGDPTVTRTERTAAEILAEGESLPRTVEAMYERCLTLIPAPKEEAADAPKPSPE